MTAQTYYGFTRTQCPHCGKRCYPTRKDARKAEKRFHPGIHMSEYSHNYLGTKYWHISSIPERMKTRPSPQMAERGRKMREREAFIEEALNEEYEKAEREGAIPWNDAGVGMRLTPREAEQLERALVSDICELDGYWDDQDGNEHYWHCEDGAVVSMLPADRTASPVKLCHKHLDDFLEQFTPESA